MCLLVALLLAVYVVLYSVANAHMIIKNRAYFSPITAEVCNKMAMERTLYAMKQQMIQSASSGVYYYYRTFNENDVNLFATVAEKLKKEGFACQIEDSHDAFYSKALKIYWK